MPYLLIFRSVHDHMRWIVILAVAAAIGIGPVALCAVPVTAETAEPPLVPIADQGARINDVSFETYGSVNLTVAMRYLSLHKGDTLEQAAVDRDYANLATLANLHPRLEIRRDPQSGGVTLHWILLWKVLEATDHPFYQDQPLYAPILGFGWTVTSPPLDSTGATVSSYSQLALRAQLARIVYTKPLWVDAGKGREGDFSVNTFGARGAYREDQPVTQDIYSWAQGMEATYLLRDTKGTQLEFGLRLARSTSAKPTYITAPSIEDTFESPSRGTTLEVGFSHGCPVSPAKWYPPNCYLQYRLEVMDSIGGLGATSEHQAYLADVAQYTRLGSSTIAVHGSLARTGGVVPTSGLLCAYTFGYAKATCGTDTNMIQTELRIAERRPGPLKFILFTETASSRVRESTQPFAPASFAWRADSGIGVQYRGFRFNFASGSAGGRITYEVQGQLF